MKTVDEYIQAAIEKHPGTLPTQINTLVLALMLQIQDARSGYQWKVVPAYIGDGVPNFPHPRLEDVLNDLQGDGWEIFSIVPASGEKVQVVARKVQS